MSDAQLGKSSERARIIRTICGLLSAPIVGSVVAMFAALIALQLITGRGFGMPTEQIIPMLQLAVALGAYVGLPVAFLFGWPIHVALMQRKTSKAMHYALFGALCAVVTFMIATTITGYVFRFIFHWEFALTGLSFLTAGAIGGIVFWFVRRPDRDQSA